MATVCRVWRMGRSGIYRHPASAPAAPPRRRGPTGAMTDVAPTAALRAVLAARPFHGEGHSDVWAELAQGSASAAAGMLASDGLGDHTNHSHGPTP
jgi:hypothetical protein